MLVTCFQGSACCGGVGGLLSLLLLVGKEVAAAQMLLVLTTQIRVVVRVLRRGRHLRQLVTARIVAVQSDTSLLRVLIFRLLEGRVGHLSTDGLIALQLRSECVMALGSLSFRPWQVGLKRSLLLLCAHEMGMMSSGAGNLRDRQRQRIVVSLMESDGGDRLMAIFTHWHRVVGFGSIFHHDVLVKRDLVRR